MLYIGLDLGTSACKLLLVDETGAVRNTVTKSYPLSFPQPGTRPTGCCVRPFCGTTAAPPPR